MRDKPAPSTVTQYEFSAAASETKVPCLGGEYEPKNEQIQAESRNTFALASPSDQPWSPAMKRRTGGPCHAHTSVLNDYRAFLGLSNTVTLADWVALAKQVTCTRQTAKVLDFVQEYSALFGPFVEVLTASFIIVDRVGDFTESGEAALQ